MGPARILTPAEAKAQGVSAIRIRRVSYRDTWDEETYTGSGAISNYATALRSDSNKTAYAVFEVRGMGFPMNGNGNTRLTIYKSPYPSHTVIATADVELYALDRDTKTVVIRSPQTIPGAAWVMPRTEPTGEKGIMVQSVVEGVPIGSPDYHNIRWMLSAT